MIDQYKKWLAIVLIISAQCSCSKFLDQNPVSATADETNWKTDDDANSGIAACYSLTRTALNGSMAYYAYGDLPSDIFDPSLETSFDRYTDIRHVRWAAPASPVDQSNPMLRLRIYSNFYAAVQQCNRSLHFIPAMPSTAFAGDVKESQDARRNQYLGEAYFVRAFNYFYMARVWGDVPLDTLYHTDISEAAHISRTPQSEVLAAAIADLNLAKQYLNWRDAFSSGRVVRGDKGSVFALMAHIYAWKGEYDSCRMACDSVINQGGYTLVPGNSYPVIYLGQSSEGIFEIAQNDISESTGAGIAFVTQAAPVLPYQTVPAWRLNASLIQTLFSDTTDLRYQSEFKRISLTNTTYYSCTKYSNIETITSSNNVNYYFAKNNIIIFRLADIILLKAEALAAQPAPDYGGALSLVNQVRARASLPDAAMPAGRAELINLVTEERGRELYLEGHRFYDLVRNQRLNNVARFDDIKQAEFQAGKYYWPIDPVVFTVNPLLTQTPYWERLLTR